MRRPRTESELIELVRSIEEPAPARLHARIDALLAEEQHDQAQQHPDEAPLRPRERSRARRPRGRRRFAAGFAVALAACAAALALVVGLGGGTGGSPTLGAASALTLETATRARALLGRGELTAAVDGVAFPYWEEGLGWRATGARTDTLGGRTVTTVFYTDARGRRIGYAIVAGTPPPALTGGTVAARGSTRYHLLRLDGASVVAWLRDGRLCVLAGRGVEQATLLGLASWGSGARQPA